MGVTSLIKVSFGDSLSFHPSVWRFRGGISTVSRFRGEILNQANTKCINRKRRRPPPDLRYEPAYLPSCAFGVYV
jgi:hypothetical protein